jgi:ApbE superfamily uncharacterized protein (UPF0280 family)
MVAASRRAGVGPMYSFYGAVTDYVGRHLSRDLAEVIVNCEGDYFVRGARRQKLTVVRRRTGSVVAVVVPASKEGVGVSMTLESAHGHADLDGLAVLADSCMVADAAAAGVQSILLKENGFRSALAYLKQVRGVFGGLVVVGDRIGLAGGVEIAA